MNSFRRVLFVAASALLWVLLQGVSLAQLREIGDGSAGPVKAEHVTAELVSTASFLAPGGTAQAALVLHLDPGWHVYWVDAGDSGEAPSVAWTLPSGVSAGPMQFAAPKRLPLGPLMDYGYEGIAVFPFDLRAASTAQKPIALAKTTAHAHWLVCREVCLPGKAYLGLTLPPQAGAAAASLIANAIAREPVTLPAGDAVHISSTRDRLILAINTGKPEQASDERYCAGG
jgi:DsbC/DsbD-like thiol-disulfide interchange protein